MMERKVKCRLYFEKKLYLHCFIQSPGHGQVIKSMKSCTVPECSVLYLDYGLQYTWYRTFGMDRGTVPYLRYGDGVLQLKLVSVSARRDDIPTSQAHNLVLGRS
jgi:hypothetical protein